MRLTVVAVALGVGLCGATTVQASDLRFRYSWVYDESRACPEFKVRRTRNEVAERLDMLQARWRVEGNTLRKRIRRITGEDFLSQPIVVYGVACGDYNISDPLTLVMFNNDGTAVADENLWRALVHELLHCAVGAKKTLALQGVLRKKYPHEHPDVLGHIIVAGMEARLFGHNATTPYYRYSIPYIRAYFIAYNEGLTEPRVP